MLHKLRLVPSLRCKRNNISYLSRLQKQAQEIGSDLKVVYILYQKSNMFENINSIEGGIKWKTCLTLVKLTSISSSESLSSSSAASTKLETFFFSFSCKEHAMKQSPRKFDPSWYSKNIVALLFGTWSTTEMQPCFLRCFSISLQ